MARLRKIKGNYYAYFRDRSRDPVEKSWPLRRTEQRAARRKLGELEEGYEVGDFDPWAGGWQRERVTLSEAIDRFLEHKRSTVSNATADTYEGILNRFADMLHGDPSLRDVPPSDVRRFVYRYSPRRDELANATQRKRYRHLRAWLNWSTDQGLLDDSPLGDVQKPAKEQKEPAYLDPQDLERLLIALDYHAETEENAVGDSPDLQWLRDMILVGVGTGLRRGELLNLRWADVDFTERRLHVRHRDGFQTKGKRERTIPLRGQALEALRQRHERRDDHLDGPVFTDRRGLPPKPDRVSRRFSDMVDVAGLDDRLTFHSLRHTTGAWLVSEGVPLKVVQAILGHSAQRVTERYAHLAPDTLDAAMDEVFGGA
jgi:integrase